MDRKTLHHAAKALGQIERIFGRWSDSPRGGIAVFTRDGDAADLAAAAAHGEAAERHSALVDRVLRRQPTGEAADEPSGEGGEEK